MLTGITFVTMTDAKNISSDNLITYPVKLVKHISSCGIASRRNSFDIIKQGKVLVNGNIVDEPSYAVQETDTVCVNGKKVSLQSFVYIMLNKPQSYVCTNSDPHADKKAIDLINCPYRLFSAGRLDKDSEGLLIFTNDGIYADRLIHPRNCILKRYEVITSDRIPESKLKDLKRGIIDDSETLKAHDIKQISNKEYIFTLNEGKKREIRRMVRYSGTRVVSLTRISIGSLQLCTLKSGEWKYMTQEDIENSLKSK